MPTKSKAKKARQTGRNPRPAKKSETKKTVRTHEGGVSMPLPPCPSARKASWRRSFNFSQRPEGATIDDMVAATGWQKHTIRSALSHALAKKRGYEIVSDKPKDGLRIYKIAAAPKQ
jgi:hypothetical protein